MDILAYIDGKSLRLYAITDDGTAEVGRLALTDVRPDAVATIVRGLKGLLAAPPKPEPQPTGMLALLNAKKAAPIKAQPRRAPSAGRRGYVSQADVLEYVRELGTVVDSYDILQHFPQLGNPKGASNKLFPLMKAGYLVRTAPGKYRATGAATTVPTVRPDKAVALVTEKPTTARSVSPSYGKKKYPRMAEILDYVRANPGRTYQELATALELGDKYLVETLRASGMTRLERGPRPAGVTTGSVPGRVYINEGDQ